MNFRKNNGFSLVELMTTVMIVGVVSAIGVPSYQKYIFRAKVAEAYHTLGAGATFEKAYFAENKRFAGGGINPPGTNNIFGYAGSAGRGSEQWLGETLSSGWTLDNAMTQFSYSTTGGADGVAEANKNSCLGIVTPVATPPPEGYTSSYFSPRNFGISVPSSGVYDWVVMIAVGNLQKGTQICKHVAFTVEATNQIPGSKRGYIEFDVDFENFSDVPSEPLDE